MLKPYNFRVPRSQKFLQRLFDILIDMKLYWFCFRRWKKMKAWKLNCNDSTEILFKCEPFQKCCHKHPSRLQDVDLKDFHLIIFFSCIFHSRLLSSKFQTWFVFWVLNHESKEIFQLFQVPSLFLLTRFPRNVSVQSVLRRHSFSKITDFFWVRKSQQKLPVSNIWTFLESWVKDQNHQTQTCRTRSWDKSWFVLCNAAQCQFICATTEIKEITAYSQNDNEEKQIKASTNGTTGGQGWRNFRSATATTWS